jgi:hypothetical protein
LPASGAVEIMPRHKTRSAVELWNEEEKALAHVHGFSRQHFIQLGAERFQPYKPVDPRKKVSRLYPFPPARGNIKEAFPLRSALK